MSKVDDEMEFIAEYVPRNYSLELQKEKTDITKYIPIDGKAKNEGIEKEKVKKKKKHKHHHKKKEKVLKIE